MPGYIINSNDDSIPGYIDYRNWERNPEKISFKDNASNITSYSPNTIRAFGVSNEVYKAAKVLVDKSPEKLGELSYSPVYQYRTDTAFLRMLVGGERSLFYYRDQTGKDNFYIYNNEKFELLKFRTFLREKEVGGSIIEIDNTYIEQLTTYLNKCDRIHQSITGVAYTQKKLITLFIDYYKCTSSHADKIDKPDNVPAQFGFVAGGSSVNIIFQSGSGDYQYLTTTNFKQTNAVVGLYLNATLPRNQGKFSIYNELLFTPYNFQTLYRENVSIDQYTVQNTTLAYSYLKLVNMFRAKFPVNKLFAFINGGITNAYAIKQKDYTKREATFYGTTRTSESKAVPEARKYEQGLTAGLGASYKKYSIEFRYEKTNGMSPIPDLNSTVKRLYFLASYKF